MLLTSHYKTIFLIGFISLLTACSTNSPVPVIDRKPDQSSSNPAQTTQKTDTKSTKQGKQHVVAINETLYSIGLQYGLDYKEIAALNGIPSPYNISPGQILRIPSVNSASTDSDTITTVPLNDQSETIIEKKTLDETYAAGDPSIPRITNPKIYREPYSDMAFERYVEVPVVEKSVNKHAPSTPSLTQSTDSQVAMIPKPITPKVNQPTSADDIHWLWPHNGKLIASFSQGSNKGIDLSGKVGEPVNAAAAGKVIYSGNDLRGYGKLIIIKHNSTFLSVYAHNSHLFVNEGQSVQAGEKIAELGSTESKIPKLHFEIRRQGTSIDPMQYLPAR